MAKSGTPRHSKPVRKPVTIEHDPAPREKSADSVSPKPNVHAAEPVGDFTPPKTARANTVKSKTSKSSAEKPISSPSQSSTIKPDTVKDTGSVSQSNSQAEPKPQPEESAKMSETATVTAPRNIGSNLIAGIAGGVIALTGAAILQWNNIIPSPDTKVTGERLALIEEEISALKIVPKTETRDQIDQQKLDQAINLAQETTEKIDALDNSTSEKLNNLQNQINNLPTESSKNINADIDALNAKIAALEEQLTKAASNASEAVANTSTDQNLIAQLQNQLAALEEKLTETVRQPDITTLIAANSLKNAIDRGGSYSAELETFRSLHPSDPSVEIFEQHSSTGIPTTADLNARFNPVADKIVATANKPAPDANLWQQLMASAKGLISIRPVGDVSGTGVGPTTARMESALHSGDLERAINEWEKLPADAKAVSQEFAEQMKLRRDADQLLTRLMTQSLQPKADAVTPQSAQ